jgi:MFS family permease
MPARDAILNEVVARRAEGGSSITLQQGVAYATLVQFGGQILGLTLAGFASQWGVVSLLIVQAGIVAIGAGAAIFLKKGQSIQTGRVGIGAAFGDIWDGVTTVTRSPVLLPMTLSMVAVGVFIIGSFLVVLPLINRDVYGMGSDGIRNMFVTFWAGAFVSSVALTRMRRASRPGRMLLLAQFLGSICILLLVLRLPYPAFLSLVFVWGLAAGVSITMSRAIVQEVAPMDRLARVLSVYQLGFMGGAPLGAALMGILSDVFGPLQVAFVPAFGMAIMVIWIALATPIWTLQMAQPDAPSPVTPKPD